MCVNQRVLGPPQELARTAGRTKVRFTVVPPGAWATAAGGDGGGDGGGGGEETAAAEESRLLAPLPADVLAQHAFEVEALEGMSLTDVAKHGDSPGAETLAEASAARKERKKRTNRERYIRNARRGESGEDRKKTVRRKERRK